MANETNQSGVKGIFMKVLFVIGVLFLLFVLGFALLIIVPKIVKGISGVAGGISSFFRSSTSDGVVVEVSDASVASDEEVILTWTDASATTVTTYSLSFSCVDDVVVFVDKKRKVCDEPLDITFNDNEAHIIMVSDTTADFADVEFTVTAIEDVSPVRKGVALVTIESRNALATDEAASPDSDSDTESATPSSQGTVTRTPVSAPAATYNASTGTDLVISSIETGTYSDSTFSAGSTNYDSRLPAVRFTVTNYGNQASGSWNFNYTHPSNPITSGTSGTQPSIGGGQSFQYIVTFSGHRSGYADVSVSLDPSNGIKETNEVNNTAIASFYFDNASGGSSSSGGSYSGDADLTVRITGTGRISNNRFIETDSVDADDEVAVRFMVTNQGGDTAEDWRYEVKIKGDETRTYTSSRQKDLGNGESIEFAIGFDDIDSDARDIEFTVEVDSDDDVDEKKENNNDDSQDVDLDR